MYQEKLVKYLQQVLPMPTEKAVQIAETFKFKFVPKNTFLIEEGKICSISHFIQEGYARMYTFDTEGKDVTTALYSN